MFHVLGEQKYEQGFLGQPDGNRPLGKLKHGWKDNIKIDIK
jgi:hypothetical protein